MVLTKAIRGEGKRPRRKVPARRDESTSTAETECWLGDAGV
jgi:hypothetical protein